MGRLGRLCSTVFISRGSVWYSIGQMKIRALGFIIYFLVFMSVSRVWPNENGLRVFIVQTDLTLDSSGPVSDVPFEQLDWAYRYADSRLQKAADAFNQEEILAELNQAFANQTTKDKLRTHMILLQVMVLLQIVEKS
jgi:hypothetical protein